MYGTYAWVLSLPSVNAVEIAELEWCPALCVACFAGLGLFRFTERVILKYTWHSRPQKNRAAGCLANQYFVDYLLQ